MSDKLTGDQNLTKLTHTSGLICRKTEAELKHTAGYTSPACPSCPSLLPSQDSYQTRPSTLLEDSALEEAGCSVQRSSSDRVLYPRLLASHGLVETMISMGPVTALGTYGCLGRMPALVSF